MSIESRSRQYGVVFEHWQIKEFLGSGSGGKTAVFKLSRMNSTHGKSALKVINLIEEKGNIEAMSASRRNEYEQAKSECKKSAEQEVWLMDEMHGNTNIVDYLDHTFVDWSDENGFGCDMLIRMELLEDLRFKLRGGREYSEKEVIKIGRDICTALVLCHSKGILHRDIKPENIFVNTDGNYKLGDFSVSRILSAAPNAVATTGIGTPEYAAPEQLTGRYDGRVDIYSLGLMLYELSNGNKLPFATTSYVHSKDLERRYKGEPLPAPCNAGNALTNVILKACAYRKEDRYQTATEFLEAINGLSGIPAVSKSASARYINGFETQKANPSTDNYATQIAANDATEKNLPYDTVPAEPTIHSAPNKKNREYKLMKPAWHVCALIVFCCIACIGVVWFREPHTHTWKEATCTVPSTCSSCGITTGSPLGHEWVDASCDTPQTCSQCIATNGSPLGHAWLPATYTSAQTCAHCGETEGYALSLLCVAAGVEHSVFLRQDGTVYACGQNIDGQCNVLSWENVSSVYAGDHTSFGLTAEGKVYSAGSNSNGQCNTSNWTDIIALAAGDCHTVGLTESGFLVGTGLNNSGQLNLDTLYGASEITDIAAGYGHTVALHSDGTVSAVGSNQYGQCDVSQWTDIIAIAVGTYHTLGLKADGTIVATGDNRKTQCNTAMWSDIVRIAAGDFFTVGIKSDGTVIVTGDNHYEHFDSSDWPNLEISKWRDIVTVACGNGHVIGVTIDGDVVASGNNIKGQCNIPESQ